MKIRSQFLIKFAAWGLARLLRMISATVRYQMVESIPRSNPNDPECEINGIYAIWHDEVLMPITARTKIKRHTANNRISALVSRHQDGSILTEFMKHFAIEAIRGSSSKGGASAIRQLLGSSEKSHIVITPDGPRGPRHRAKQGIIYVASQTGMPLLVNVSAVSRCWNLKGNWTNLIVPKPFAKAWLLISEPMYVPPDLTREQIEEYQHKLDAEFERLTALAKRFLSGELTEMPLEERTATESSESQRAA